MDMNFVLKVVHEYFAVKLLVDKGCNQNTYIIPLLLILMGHFGQSAFDKICRQLPYILSPIYQITLPDWARSVNLSWETYKRLITFLGIDESIYNDTRSKCPEDMLPVQYLLSKKREDLIEEYNLERVERNKFLNLRSSFRLIDHDIKLNQESVRDSLYNIRELNWDNLALLFEFEIDAVGNGQRLLWYYYLEYESITGKTLDWYISEKKEKELNDLKKNLLLTSGQKATFDAYCRDYEQRRQQPEY